MTFLHCVLPLLLLCNVMASNLLSHVQKVIWEAWGKVMLSHTQFHTHSMLANISGGSPTSYMLLVYFSNQKKRIATAWLCCVLKIYMIKLGEGRGICFYKEVSFGTGCVFKILGEGDLNYFGRVEGRDWDLGEIFQDSFLLSFPLPLWMKHGGLLGKCR